MRFFPFRNEVFSSVVSLFTSFGYLPSEKEDIDCIREISRTLQPKGSFLIDVINHHYLLKMFKESDTADFGTFIMEEKRSLNNDRTKITGQWIVTEKVTGERKTLEHQLRLYTPESLRQLLTSENLLQRALYGSYEGGSFGPESPRLIILVEKATTETPANL
jgi:SAM-dependent methyltransferase